jgi:hypothetical protein
MTTIIPEGEKVKQALRWISQQKEGGKASDFSGLIRDASLRFNLSPKDEEFLYAFYRDKGN